MSGLRSVSIACAALSVLTTFTYAMALNSILFIKYMEAKTEYQESPWFADKGAKIEFRKEEKTMIAVHVFIIICSILEIILVMASVQTGKAMAKEPQDIQVCEITPYAVNKLDTTTTKDDIPNFSDTSCSLSAFILEEEYKGTLPTLDVKDVIFRKIIQILVQFIFMPNAKFFNSELYYFERISAISHYLPPKGTLGTGGFLIFCNDVHLTPPLRLWSMRPQKINRKALVGSYNKQ